MPANLSNSTARSAIYAINRLPALGDDTRPEALTMTSVDRLLQNLTPRPATHLEGIMDAYPLGLGMDFGEWRRRALNCTREVEASRQSGIVTRLPRTPATSRAYVVTLECPGDDHTYFVEVDPARAACVTANRIGSTRAITSPALLGHMAELIDAAFAPTNGITETPRHTIGHDTLAAIGFDIAAKGASTAKETDHTPGPWHAYEDTDIVSDNGDFIATTHQPGSCIGTEREYANAKLIAAAPAMLAALEAALYYVDADEAPETYAAVTAAIAAAKGEG